MRSASWIELSKSALSNNLEFIRGLLAPDTELFTVVKGNSYGHGTRAYAPLLHALGQRHFCVFSAEEAYELYHCLNDPHCTIIIMGAVQADQMEWVVDKNIEFFVFNQERLDHARDAAKKLNSVAKLHVEVETGMNRTGFEPKTFRKLFSNGILQDPHMQVKGICTHLAGAESIANYKRIQEQIKRFKRIRELALDGPFEDLQFHALCSAGLIRYPKQMYDLVRVGILQYGYYPSMETQVHFQTRKQIMENPLKRVLTWKTRVMDISEVGIGQFVGYGTNYFTNHPTRVAIIPVGYSDGFARKLSNNGKVIIRGQRLNVIGIVNMNMIAVNITGIEGVETGDEVILIGKDGDADISVASFAETSEQVNYELLTRLPHDIDRSIVD